MNYNVHSLSRLLMVFINISLNPQRFGTVLSHIAGEPRMIHNQNVLYTVVHKKRDIFIFSITLANIDGFS